MPPASMEPGSVELAVATRREVFDPRRRMVIRLAVGWGMVGVGTATFVVSMLLDYYGTTSPLLLLLLGVVAAALGLGRVDRVRAELRRYDQHVRPLPRARLRGRLPPP